MYGVLIDHDYSPAVIMMCRYVFTMGSEKLFQLMLLLIVPDYK